MKKFNLTTSDYGQSFAAFAPPVGPSNATSQISQKTILDKQHFIQKQNVHEIARRENIRVEEALEDVSVFPGKAATRETIKENKEKILFLDLIHHFATQGFCHGDGSEEKITTETALAATTLFDTLLPNVKTPRISPDGEGGLVAAWEDGDDPVLLVIDNWTFHLVKSAATPHAEYFDDLPFDGERIPQVLIDAVSSR